MGAKKLQPMLLFGDGKDPGMFNLRHSQVLHRSLSLQHRCHQTYIAVHLLKIQPESFHNTKHTRPLQKSSSFPFCQEIQVLTGCVPVTSTFFNKASYHKYTFHYFTARWSLATILDTALETKSSYQTVPSLGIPQQSFRNGPEPRTSFFLHWMFTKRK